jgi:hypothetical protein
MLSQSQSLRLLTETLLGRGDLAMSVAAVVVVYATYITIKGSQFSCFRARCLRTISRSKAVRKALVRNSRVVVGGQPALESVHRMVDDHLAKPLFRPPMCPANPTTELLQSAVSRLTLLAIARSSQCKQRLCSQARIVADSLDQQLSEVISHCGSAPFIDISSVRTNSAAAFQVSPGNSALQAPSSEKPHSPTTSSARTFGRATYCAPSNSDVVWSQRIRKQRMVWEPAFQSSPAIYFKAYC